jgi:dienelactone hydrolase
VLADAGVAALAIRWFGLPGQQPGPYEVPLELFSSALDRLAQHTDRLGVLGTSFGAEAALLTAAWDRRVRACVAIAPSSVVWAGVDGSGRMTSHWTHGGVPLSYVPLVEDWHPDSDPPAFRGLYEQSLVAAGEGVDTAAIPVERISGEVVLVAGGDDHVWPSVAFAERIAARRSSHHLPTTVVTHAPAGHRTVLPGEDPVSGGQRMARGGTPEADAELGARAWPAIRAALS